MTLCRSFAGLHSPKISTKFYGKFVTKKQEKSGVTVLKSSLAARAGKIGTMFPTALVAISKLSCAAFGTVSGLH